MIPIVITRTTVLRGHVVSPGDEIPDATEREAFILFSCGKARRRSLDNAPPQARETAALADPAETTAAAPSPAASRRRARAS